MTSSKPSPGLLALRASIAAALALLAGAAQAQVAAPAPAPLPAWRGPVVAATSAAPAIDLTAPRTPLAVSYAQSVALREAGVARTSVDRRFARDGLVGSVGFLCGLQPRLDENSGSAYGFDPHGRFLGAKLSRAF